MNSLPVENPESGGGWRVLVSGANGFLGSHVVGSLKARGVKVIASARQPSDQSSIPLDVTDRGAVLAAFKHHQPTHVIHCAAYGVDQSLQDYGASFAVNVTGTKNVLEAAKEYGCRRLVHVGSCSEYAGQEAPIREDEPQRPTNLYGISKAAGSLLALEFGATAGLPVVVVRPFGLWGPGEASYRLVPQVVEACRLQQRLDLTPCDIVRDYTFVSDMAAWVASMALDPSIPAGDVINLGSGKSVVLREFVLSIASLLGGTDLLDFGARPHRPNEQHSLVPDIARLAMLLPNRPQTLLSDGVRQMSAMKVQ